MPSNPFAYAASERERLTDAEESEIAALDDYLRLWPPGLVEALDRYLAENAVADLGPTAT